MITRAEYEQKIKEHIDNNMPKILSDKWRSKYHIMAPIGWINDPTDFVNLMMNIMSFINIHL